MHNPEITGRKMSAGAAGVAPLAHSVNDACALLGISRAHFYVLVGRGEIRLVKLGNKSVVPTSEILRVLGEQEAA